MIDEFESNIAEKIINKYSKTSLATYSRLPNEQLTLDSKFSDLIKYNRRDKVTLKAAVKTWFGKRLKALKKNDMNTSLRELMIRENQDSETPIHKFKSSPN